MKLTCDIRIYSSKVESINPVHSQTDFEIYFCQDILSVSQVSLLGVFDKYILDLNTSIL